MSLFKKNKFNTNGIKLNKENKKNHLDIFYFALGDNPSILVKKYLGNKLINIKEIKLNKDQIDNNAVILNNEFVINEIKEVGRLKGSINLNIDTLNTFKTIISLPKISSSKAEKLKKKELKNSFDKYSKSYHLIEYKYFYNLGVVYEEYFINNELIKNWAEISKGSNLRLSSISLFSNYLFNSFMNKEFEEKESLTQEENQEERKSKKKKDKSRDFSIIHVFNNIATFVLGFDNQLIDAYSFEFKDSDDLIKKYITVIGKHEIEFEKKLIKDIFLDSDVELSLNDVFKDVNIHPIHFNFFDELNSKDEEKSNELVNEENPLNE